jgi:hypothetical protein
VTDFPPGSAEKTFGDVVSDVSEKASLLVREEIELAKAEIQDKATKIGKGVGVGAAAGLVLVFAIAMFLHGLAFLLNDLLNQEDNVWLGYFIVTGMLILLGALAGYLAYRWLQSGAPPTPDLAIEEARRTRAMIEQDDSGARLEASKEHGRELEETTHR